MNDRQENLLLASLSRKERERLEPFLHPVEVELSEVLIKANEPITHMFFPYDSVTSTLQELSDGSTIETGLMGIEGMIGIQFWLGMPSTPTETIVQVGGKGHRMNAKDFKREVMANPDSRLDTLVGRYTHAFLVMTSLVAACNRLHTVDQRMCRWLKLLHNRVRRNSFPMRQEFMAMMLGVYRETLSKAASALQAEGLIKYSRGHLTILDPPGVAACSCECLELMEKQFDRIFEQPWRDLADSADKEQ